jgi:putative ATP-dependent endonuclease of OLD family
MHPQARRHLAKVLREVAESGLQVIISTHSASFLDTEFFDSVGRVVKVDDDEEEGRKHSELLLVPKRRLVEHCVATGVPADKTSVANIGEFYKTTSNPMLNEAFFARFLILVEGDTEELALPIYLEKEGFDTDLLGISIISVRGKNQIPKYWRLFSAFQIPLLVIADNDNDGRKANSNKQLAACFGVELDDLLDVQISKLLYSQSEPQTPIIMLERDFEYALRSDFDAWTFGDTGPLDQWDAEARDLIQPLKNQNKGQIARFIARRLCAEKPEITLSFVKEIVEVLEANGFRSSKQDASDDASQGAGRDAASITDDPDDEFPF